SHRLRLSASRYGAANPAQINFKQEPLDFRRGSLSLPLSLLMSAFALPIPPDVLTDHPSQAYGTLRYRSHLRVNPELRCMALAPLHFRRKDPYLEDRKST